VRIRAKLVTLALTLALTIAVTACGADDGSTDRVAGSGYSYAVPGDWDDRTDESKEEAELELAGVRPDTVVTSESRDGFATNVNVIREEGLPEGVTAGDYAHISQAGLRDPVSAGFPPEVVEVIEAMKVRDLSDAEITELAGERGATLQYASSRAGRPLRHRQLIAVRSNAAYTLTYTAPEERFEEDLPAFEEIIESWRWE
jgi:hypothetical protein